MFFLYTDMQQMLSLEQVFHASSSDCGRWLKNQANWVGGFREADIVGLGREIKDRWDGCVVRHCEPCRKYFTSTSD